MLLPKMTLGLANGSERRWDAGQSRRNTPEVGYCALRRNALFTATPRRRSSSPMMSFMAVFGLRLRRILSTARARTEHERRVG